MAIEGYFDLLGGFAASLIARPSRGALEASIGWIDNVLIGQIAVGLCVIAVAFIGFLMLTGRLPVRDGARVALGCFILLGAPVIAKSFLGFAGTFGGADAPPPITQAPSARAELPRAQYDPYAGASLPAGR